jgi:hypothetical protein
MSHNITREQALVSLMRLQALGVTDMEIKNFRPSDTCLIADFNGLDLYQLLKNTSQSLRLNTLTRIILLF